MYRLLELRMCSTNLADFGVGHAIWVAIEALVLTASILLRAVWTFLYAIWNSWNLLDYQVVLEAVDVFHSWLIQRWKLVYYLAHVIKFSWKKYKL